jgi:methionyl aminopeptidase
VRSAEELQGLRAAGRVVARALAAMRRLVAPGVSTGALDAVADAVFAAAGARSAPRLEVGFPATTCISVNDEAVHGIPGPRRLRAGDLVKLDVTAELDGFFADACRTVPVGAPGAEATRLALAAERALARGVAAATAGAPLNAIGAAVERSVAGDGFALCDGLTGHGIGRRMHEPPTVPNAYLEGLDAPLTQGLVITVEPIICSGRGAVRHAGDGWTVCTADRSLSAHAEDTVVVTSGAPIVLTA